MSNEHDAPRNGEPPRIDDGTTPAEPPRIDDGTPRADAPRIDEETTHADAPRIDDGTPRADAPRIDDGTAPAEPAAPTRTDAAPPLVEPAAPATSTYTSADDLTSRPDVTEPAAPAEDAAAAEPAATDEPPRYGERITPTPASAPESGAWTASSTTAADAPAYGERTTGAAATPRDDTRTQAYGAAPTSREAAPTYGEAAPTQAYAQQAPAYGEQPTSASGEATGPSDQQWTPAPQAAAAPVYGHPNGSGWQAYDEPKPVKKKKTVGVVAFIVGLLALVLGVVAGYLFGHAVGSNDAFRQAIMQGGSSSGLSESETTQLQQDMMRDPATAGQFAVGCLMFVGGTVFGLWAIVQGIIAAATKRGRAFGVLAIVLAVLGFIAVLVTTGVGLGDS